MRQPLIAANWKLHKTIAEARQFVVALSQQCPDPGPLEVVIAAPFTALAALQDQLRSTPFRLAAQDLFWENSGAYTGEVSAAMLKDIGCRYVIVGHSERRLLYRESDQLVARKFSAAHAKGLNPIGCVGEQLADREAGRAREIVARQLDVVLELCGAGTLDKGVVAYEPVWAIGTGRNATPDQAQEVHAFIRGRIAARDARIAAATRILYGGSVKAGNAVELFNMPDVDGGLIGGASLKADEFLGILAAARPAE
jgi:triosephosphate isomerase